MKLKTYKRGDIKQGTRVLVRVDANVPIVNGKVVDGPTGRIARSLPEIEQLRELGAKIILMTHLGDPGGRLVKALSTRPIAEHYGRLLDLKVIFSSEIIGREVEDRIESMKPGEVMMLENLRFERGEEADSRSFARALARLGDVYVNNAFGVCHRTHASVHMITKFLPSFAGSLVIEEVHELSRPLEKPAVLMMGGLKLDTKLPMIEKLAPKCSAILTGGGLAVTLLAARSNHQLALNGKPIEAHELSLARKILTAYGDKIVLPIDVKATSSARGRVATMPSRKLNDRLAILDIGPATQKRYADVLKLAKTVVWNGPLGVVENKDGMNGTLSVAKVICGRGAIRSVVGGGDTVSFLESHKLASGMSFISTGGGAMLAFLGGERMPGLEPLVIK